MTEEVLKAELVADLAVELKNEETFDEELLAVKVQNAIREVKIRRNYSATTFDNGKIAEDLYNHYSIIRSVALFDYNQIGAEFQTASNENGISRTYVNREDLFKNVYSFIKVL